ncbi:hypothetical protein MKW94_016648 [Papaver nudicaule]|uniref:Glutamine amidotransferase domain-containing protein n=1 Tax=Papaver nudicaule TaxID=74823 RepID=A0AA41VGH3_PAPNU|nr:hypothetical protein [Papaver nudicaule]
MPFGIENYDSFTYNLCQYIGEMGCAFEVYRNDELTVEELKMNNPRGILISPGFGETQDSGISLQTDLNLDLLCLFLVFAWDCSALGKLLVERLFVHCLELCTVKALLCFMMRRGRTVRNWRFQASIMDRRWIHYGCLSQKVQVSSGSSVYPESIITTEGKTIVHNFLKLVEKFENA